VCSCKIALKQEDIQSCTQKIGYTEELRDFNFSIGTQAIDHSYKFTNETGLVEMAKGIRAMGSNIIKIVLQTGKGKYSDLDYKPTSLKDLAENEPSFKTVLDMDFSYYLMWAYGPASFNDGMSQADKDSEYKAIYDLTSYLLTKYDNTGKTFFLGNWEGDWHLVNDFDGAESWDGGRKDIKNEWIESMSDWFNVRQKAVDDAKKKTKHSNVEVYHYIEVCLVKSAMNGLPRLSNRVLPLTNPDFVSYSCYDITNIVPGRSKEQMKTDLLKGLDFIEGNLKPKPEIKGKRVFIGEYGYPYGPGFRNNQVASPDEQDAWSRNVLKAGLEWGTPFILQWAFYNNEIDKNGKQIGFWMIDDKNEKQPLYNTYSNYYGAAKKWVANFYKENQRLPERAEYNSAAVKLIDEVSNQP
jgi:hypothetical protein